MIEKQFGEDSADVMQQEIEEMDEMDAGGQEEQVVTVVLTADNHLGYAASGQSPRKREEWQQRLRSSFQQATDFAIGQSVDLFIQAGDLFDTTTPDERDRSFVAARLAQLRQANVRVFALGGIHDTPADAHTATGAGEDALAPQQGYASLGALTYFAPGTFELEPVILDIHGVLVGICGLSVLAEQSGDPLARMHVASDIERAAIPLLILHAPIEGLDAGSSLVHSHAQVSRESLERQATFRTVLAGYHHTYQQLQMGQCDVVVAGATHHVDFDTAGETPGFVFLGLDRNGIRWCKHIAVDVLPLHSLVIRTEELWPSTASTSQQSATDAILARLQPLCDGQTMVQLRLEGTLTRQQYHQLDLNRLRRSGEEQAFAFAIDDSDLELLPEDGNSVSAGASERFSPREELITLADEWIAAAPDEQEKKALRATREELLAAMDEIRIKL
ncbi:MAG: metallophosphoesterase [Ktedonobacteraceae bacterium]